MDGGTCWATVHGGTKESDTTERRNNKEMMILCGCEPGAQGKLMEDLTFIRRYKVGQIK